MPQLSTEYEILVRDLHAALMKDEGVENVAVLHNVKIRGRSGALHQIDVYWEFKIAGVKYKTCIECKHYNRPVKKEHVATLISIIDDIGNSTGIFATTVGYQPGAILLAKQKNIRLLAINHLLKSISITSNFSIPMTDILDIKYDTTQARECLIERGLSSFSLTSRWNNETEFFNPDGTYNTTLRKLFNDSVDSDGSGVLHPVELYDQTEIGMIKVVEIAYRRTTESFKSAQEIMINDVSRAIMEDVLENSSCYLHDDGSISKLET